MGKPTKKQRLRATLRYAFEQLLLAESEAHDAAVTLAQSKKKLAHARATMRMAAEDARQGGVL